MVADHAGLDDGYSEWFFEVTSVRYRRLQAPGPAPAEHCSCKVQDHSDALLELVVDDAQRIDVEGLDGAVHRLRGA
jgi:hypothetical protein